MSIVRDPGLAEDVTQETFIKVWEKRSTFRGDAPIRGWILQIAHHTAVSRLRKIRDEQAGRLKIDPTLVASKATLLSVSQHPQHAKKHLMKWQRKLLKLD